MTFDLDLFMRVSPVVSGLVVASLFWRHRFIKEKKTSLEDFFIVAIAGSSFPSGFLIVASAFNPTLLTKLSDSPIYIALAGCAVIYIACKTVKEKGAT